MEMLVNTDIYNMPRLYQVRLHKCAPGHNDNQKAYFSCVFRSPDWRGTGFLNPRTAYVVINIICILGWIAATNRNTEADIELCQTVTA